MRERGITGARNNPSKPTGTVQYVCVCVCCVCARACCLFVVLQLTNKSKCGSEGRGLVNVIYSTCSSNYPSSCMHACKRAIYNAACEKMGWNVRSRCCERQRDWPRGPTETMCSQSVTVGPSSLQRLFDVSEAFKFNPGESQGCAGFDLSQEKPSAFPSGQQQNVGLSEKALAMVSATSVTLNLLCVHLPSYIFSAFKFCPSKIPPCSVCFISLSLKYP